MYYFYYLFSESNTKMTPTSQEAVSGEVLSEHVSRIFVCCNKVQGDLSFADSPRYNGSECQYALFASPGLGLRH